MLGDAVFAEREFLGIAGTDIRMSHLEPELLAVLRDVSVPAVLVTGERRVVAANTPRWIPGTGLDRPPAPGDGTFAAVTEVGADSGWLLAAALLPTGAVPPAAVTGVAAGVRAQRRSSRLAYSRAAFSPMIFSRSGAGIAAGSALAGESKSQCG